MYPGKIEPFLDYQEERREQAIRENASTITKQKQLERFIAKNRAGANTASQARSKQKQLDRLKLNEIALDEKTAYIQAPVVEPRQGAAVRCEGLAIGYPDHRVAEDIHIEIEHQQRTAIVGDNGQGKTTLLRTLVGSLKPLDGEVSWGHGCEIGVYAQHVYTSFPQTKRCWNTWNTRPTRERRISRSWQWPDRCCFATTMFRKKSRSSRVASELDCAWRVCC